MSFIIASLLPIFLVIATGWLMRIARIVEDTQWGGIERATYYVLFPALIIDTLAGSDLASVPVFGVGGALVATILVLATVLVLLQSPLARTFGIDGASFTSVFQGALRWNSFVGLAVAGNLAGGRGITLVAVALATIVPLLNILSVLVFIRYGGEAGQKRPPLLKSLAQNPFIIACAIGLILNGLHSPLPEPVMATISILGRASLAIGLLVVGAGLDIRRLAKPGAAHVIASAVKLIALPLVALGFAALISRFGETMQAQDVMIMTVVATTPTASAAYVLAKQLGGNAPLMAEILTLETLAAFITMPMMILLLT